VRFVDGSVLQFESAWATHREPMQDGYYVRLFGSEAGANFFTGAKNGDTVSMFKYINDQPSTVVPRLATNTNGHRMAVHHFVDSIMNGSAPESPGEHGLVGLKIIDAIYQSAKEGKEIALS